MKKPKEFGLQKIIILIKAISINILSFCLVFMMLVDPIPNRGDFGHYFLIGLVLIFNVYYIYQYINLKEIDKE